jgi:ribosomal protein L29
MNIKDIRNKTESELNKQIKEIKKDLETFVSNILQKKEKNVKKGMFLRKDLAKIKTVLNERKRSDA